MIIIDLTLKTLAVLLIFLAIGKLLKSYTGSTRYSVWKFAFISVLLIPLVSLVLPPINLSLFHEVIPAQSLKYLPAQYAIPMSSLNETANVPSGPISQITTPRAEELSVSSVDAQPSRFSLPDLLFILWLAGAVSTLLIILSGQLYLHVLKRKGRQITSAEIIGIIERCSADGRSVQDVEIYSSDGIIVPITWGWRRGIIMIPSGYPEWSRRKLELNLIHEMEHIRRKDFLWNFFINICCALHWFNPLVWLAAGISRRERERSIDELIVGKGVKPSDYAYHLIETASSFSAVNLVFRSPLAVSKGSSIKERVISVLNSAHRGRAISGSNKALAIILLLCAVTLFAAVNVWKSEESPSNSKNRILASLNDHEFDRTTMPLQMQRYEQALQFMEEKNYREAEAILVGILEEYPYFGAVMDRLVDLYYLSQEYEKSIEMASKIVRLRPDLSMYLYGGMGLFYAQMKDMDRAFHWLYRSVEAGILRIDWLEKKSEFEKIVVHEKWKQLVEAYEKSSLENLRAEYVHPEFDSILNVTVPNELGNTDIAHLSYVALTDGDHAHRSIALQFIAGSGAEEGVEVILETIRHEPDPDVIAAGFYSLLCKPYKNDISERILELCREVENPWVDVYGGGVLGRFRPEQAAEILRDATFTDIDHECHEDAISILAEMQEGKGVDALRYIYLNHPSTSIRELAKETLDRLW